MKKVLTLIAMNAFVINLTQAQTAPPINWQNTIGGSDADLMTALSQTADGGYICGGYSWSESSGDKTENCKGGFDYWIVKLNNSGGIEWQNTIGGDQDDKMLAVSQTADGGYICGGYSESDITGDKSENGLGGYDYWIIKLNSFGNIEWQNTIGGHQNEMLDFISPTIDGGYICGGSSKSNISGDKTENCLGAYDYWVIKLDLLGDIQWQNTIGGDQDDRMYAISQTADGGFICGGYSLSNISGDKTENSLGGSDYWIIKLDPSGNIQWQNTIGGDDGDYLNSICQTADGGYICGGSSYFDNSGDKTEDNNDLWYNDYWVIKLDSSGNIEWQNTIGGESRDAMTSIYQTVDGGYICGGNSDSDISGDKTENNQGPVSADDYWVIKLDSYGSIEWQNTIGGDQDDELCSISQTADGRYICGGYSESVSSGDKTEDTLGQGDYWVVKIYSCLDSAKFFADADGDGFGNSNVSVFTFACSPPDGYIPNSSDCDDENLAVHPDGKEECNDIDDNCDGFTDEGFLVTFYLDADQDGYGSSSNTIDACSQPDGYVPDPSDCNDADFMIHPEAAALQWQKSLGGDENDAAAFIHQTPDGGYFVAGTTSSNTGDVLGNHGYSDYWIAKLDSSQNLLWQKCLGGSSSEGISSVYPTNDDGFIIAGPTSSFGGDVSGNHGETDYWILKVDSSGNIEWKKCLGGTHEEYASSIEQTSDGGFIIAGYSESDDGDVSGNHGLRDYWIVKLDAIGNIHWQKCLGGTHSDFASSISQTSDGGYIISGSADSDDGNVSGHHGSDWTSDCWIVKLDGSGNLQWQKSLGGSEDDSGSSIEQTTDGGFIVAGSSYSLDGDLSSNQGEADCWIVRLDGLGNILWQKSIGGSDYERPSAIHQTPDLGFIVAGYTRSNNGDVSGNHGAADYWVIKLDDIGNLLWKECLGGSDNEYLRSMEPTPDGGYIISGNSSSNNGNVSGHHGNQWYDDIWILKLKNSPGGIEMCNAIDDNCNGTTDEGFFTLDYYADVDGDNYGDPNSMISACVQPGGYIADSTDCDDNNPNINTGATEIIGNGLDDNCNGYLDEFGTVISENGNQSMLIVSPNPNDGHFTIEIKTSLKEILSISVVDVFNRTGFFSYEGEIDGTIIKTLDLSHLASGCYFLKIVHDNECVVRQILIER